jgi:RNA polymerase sigma-70 factor, ECF subfamily
VGYGVSFSQRGESAADSVPLLGPLRHESLENLVHKARTGSSSALGQLLEGCRKYLLLIAHRELDSDLRPKAGASDLVQEAFYEAQCDIAQFRGTTAQEFLAWLTGIMNHRLANHVRHYRGTHKRNVDREIPLSANLDVKYRGLSSTEVTPSELVIARDEQSQLLAALARLPDQLRRVLVLRTWERASFVEIGVELNISADAARKQWSRAVLRLRQEIGGSDDA